MIPGGDSSGGGNSGGKEIARRNAGAGGLVPRTALKAAKKAAKHAVEKHAAKKAAAKKGAKHSAKHAAKKGAKHAAKKEAKTAARDWDAEEQQRELKERRDAELDADDLQLTHSFHHLHRAAVVISLLEHDSGGDLKMLLQHGMELYRNAAGTKQKTGTVRSAFGLLRAAEHLGMAGLYSARSEYRAQVPPPPRREGEKQLRELGPRLDRLKSPERENGRRLCNIARELLNRAQGAGHDPHLEYELTMAAEGICIALEDGI